MGGLQDRSRLRPRWRRLIPRLSVRGLMVLVLIVGGWLGWVVRSARVQREAVAAIDRAGGFVRYDFQEVIPSFEQPRPPWPRWLVDALGVDYFAQVVAVDFGPAPYPETVDRIDDAVMAQIGRLSHLESLSIYHHDAVNDAMLVHLGGLRRLRSLSLMRTGVRGSGLAHLTRLSALEELHLSGQPVTDADLAHIAGLSGLEEISLCGALVTDAGLAHLGGLTNLRKLILCDCPITSAGLAHLGRLTRLEYLDLDRTKVDNLEPLRPLTGLTDLELRNLPIDDADIPPLLELRGLTYLSLNRTRVGDRGLALLADLPALELLSINPTRT